MCSLCLSANVLPHSPMYSVSQSTLPHLYCISPHPTFLPVGISVLRFSKKVFNSTASLEVQLYAMFATDVLQLSLKPLMYSTTM